MPYASAFIQSCSKLHKSPSGEDVWDANFPFCSQFSILCANFPFCMLCRQQLASVIADMSSMREKWQTDVQQVEELAAVAGFHLHSTH